MIQITQVVLKLHALLLAKINSYSLMKKAPKSGATIYEDNHS
jgi:hypothetical protein